MAPTSSTHDLSDPSGVLARVRKALGRTSHRAAEPPPAPPALHDPVVRLVYTDIGLPELFAKRAEENKIAVEWAYAEELLPKLIDLLKAHGCRKVALPASAFLDKLGVVEGLAANGFDARRWTDMTLDEAYDLDAGITDVYAAVAEVGALVLRSTPEHGKAISLVPPLHVAILQPKDFVPDLVDLMEKLGRDGLASATVIITGPSKTADIEMSLVVGVHGPGKVAALLLR